jgi:hypothetical protein
MAPVTSWTNGKLPPRRSFIDLTQDDDEDDDVEDKRNAADQVSYHNTTRRRPANQLALTYN